MNALKADHAAYMAWLEWTIDDVRAACAQGRKPTYLPPYMALALIDGMKRMSA